MINDIQKFILIIFITIAIIIILNILFRYVLLYILFNKLKNNGNYSTPHIIIIVIIAIYLLMYFISKQSVHKSQTHSKD